jgi:two-component system, OmpR family, response regulator
MANPLVRSARDLCLASHQVNCDCKPRALNLDGRHLPIARYPSQKRTVWPTSVAVLELLGEFIMSVQLRVLVIDDSRDTLLILERLVRELNCDVRTCLDSKKAVAIAQAFSPHVIFLDISMPDLDGYEVAEDLHELVLPEYTLVALTSHEDEAHRRECEISGFDSFLSKPATIEEIKSVIEWASTRFQTQIFQK